MLSREWKFLILLIIIFIGACIETDIYLPAFTDIMAFFAISEEQVQSLLTWNFVGICVSGPFYGPLSDAFGRKKPLMFGLGIFLVGSLITLVADSFSWMLFGRILQGIGSGGCFTLGTAILFDVFEPKQAVQALNKINSIVPFIMAAAPLLGGYLNQAYGFRSNFLAIALCVLASFLICWLWFEETLGAEKRVPFQMKKVLKDFGKVVSSVPFWQTTLIVCLLFGGYLAFLAGISVLYILELGVEKHLLPLHQAALLGAWLMANFMFRPCMKRLGAQKIKFLGTLLVACGGAFLLGILVVAPENPYLLTVAMVLYSFGVNWTQGLYFPEGMELFPDIKGVTASILTSARLLIAAFVVGLTSWLYDSTSYPIAGVVCGIVMTTLIIIVCYEKKKATRECSESV